MLLKLINYHYPRIFVNHIISYIVYKYIICKLLTILFDTFDLRVLSRFLLIQFQLRFYIYMSCLLEHYDVGGVREECLRVCECVRECMCVLWEEGLFSWN